MWRQLRRSGSNYMLWQLLNFVLSVDQRNYRQCKDSPFCTRNRFVETQSWKILPKESITVGHVFSAPIFSGKYHNLLNLSIAFLSSRIVHVKIVPRSSSFERYDCSKEAAIVNQSLLNNALSFEQFTTNESIILKSGQNQVQINIAPFFLDVISSGGTVRINSDDRGVFELPEDLDEDEYPDHWEKADFGGYLESLRNGPASVAMTFKFYGDGTRFSGLPHHTLNLSLPSTIDNGSAITDPIRFYNTDINRFEIRSVMAMYGAIPYLVSHNQRQSTSVFWCNPSETWTDIDNRELSARFISETGLIDVFIMSGRHEETVQSYTELTGRPPLPQLFALGYHQCRWTYYTDKELMEVSDGLNKAKIPHDSMWMDLDHTDEKKYFTFNYKYGDVNRLIDHFVQLHKRVVAQVDPHLKVDTHYRIYKEALANHYLVKTAEGTDFVGNCWPGKSAWVDFMNPQARYWWSQQYDFRKYKGSSRYLFTWNDMNEPAVFDSPDISLPRDTQHYKGYENRAVHNLYGHMMIAATYEGLLRRNKNLDERPFVLTRSFFSGSQKYAFMWTGDNTANWDQLRNSISQILHLGIAGFPFSGADVGGFFDSPDAELLTRWYQLGAYCYPFFRCHCHHLSAKREPFRLPPTYQERTRKAIVERYMLLPLWYTLSKESHDTGSPIVRPLWWHFTDEEVQDLETEVIIGSSLLVAPILEKGCTQHTIYLPKDTRWYDWRLLNEVESGWRQVNDVDQINGVPAFLRGGSICPVKFVERLSSEEMIDDPIDLIIALDESQRAQGTLYIDDGHTFGYEKGALIYKQFSFDSDYIQCNSLVSKTKYHTRSTIRNIIITGLTRIPVSATAQNRQCPMSWNNNILNITLNIPVEDDWQIQLHT